MRARLLPVLFSAAILLSACGLRPVAPKTESGASETVSQQSPTPSESLPMSASWIDFATESSDPVATEKIAPATVSTGSTGTLTQTASTLPTASWSSR